MKSPRAFAGLLLGALALFHHGAAAVEPCEDLVACPAVEDEVCGSNGHTYSNDCVLRMDQCKDPRIVLVARGACPTPPTFDCPVILCPSIYEPVCGTDGKTYPSECSLNADKCSHPGLSLAYKGECGEPIEDPAPEPSSSPAPVPAPPSACDDSVCTADGTPICGTDGKTYANICHLTVATCRDASVKGRHYGECGGPRQCDLICPFEDDPVCGSDGETYENPCALQAASCKAVAAGGRPLEFTSKGECVPTDTNPQTDDTAAGSSTTAPAPTPTPTVEAPIGSPNELPPSDEQPIGQPTDIDNGDEDAPTTAPTGASPVEPATTAPEPEPTTAATTQPADVVPVVIVVEPAPTTAAPSSDELPIGQPTEVDDGEGEPTVPPSPPALPPVVLITPRTTAPAPVSDAPPTELPAPPAPEPEPTQPQTETPPAPVDTCEVPCPMHSNFLVCATNGATFTSLCELSIAMCRDASLSALHPGECVTGATAPPQPWDKEFDQCAFMCPMLYDPVCTELGQAFDNKCIYASAFCRDPTLPVATADNCGALVRIPVAPPTTKTTTSSSP